MGKIKLWTENEEEFLKNNYPNYGPKWCGEKLNRVVGGIKIRASKLGLKYNNVKLKYQKEYLQNIINNSNNMINVLIKLNLRCAGGNFQTIKKYIKLYDINVEHFETSEEKYIGLLNYNAINKIPTEDILVINSTYNRTNLKLRLISEKLLDYRCNLCENIGKWNNKPITLQLDHINGIYNDNRIENLRFLCPNCHSQTENYAGKKNKKVKVKSKEISIIKRESLYKRRKVDRPNYEILIEEIEKLGYKGTGKKYSVSDNTIRKWKIFYQNHEFDK